MNRRVGGGEACSVSSRHLLEEFAGSRVVWWIRIFPTREEAGENDGENDDDSNSKVIKINLLPVLFVVSVLFVVVLVETLKR